MARDDYLPGDLTGNRPAPGTVYAIMRRTIIALAVALCGLSAVACDDTSEPGVDFATPDAEPQKPAQRCELDADWALGQCLAEDAACGGQWDSHCYADHAAELEGCTLDAEQAECLESCYAQAASDFAWRCAQSGRDVEFGEVADTCPEMCGL